MKKVIRLNEKELSDLIRKVISEEKGQIKNRKNSKKIIKEDLNEVDFNYEEDKEPSEEEIIQELDTLYRYMDNLYNDAFDEISAIDKDLASELSQHDIEPHDLAEILDDLSENGPRHLSILAHEILMLQDDIDEIEDRYHEVRGPIVHTKWTMPEE